MMRLPHVLLVVKDLEDRRVSFGEENDNPHGPINSQVYMVSDRHQGPPRRRHEASALQKFAHRPRLNGGFILDLRPAIV